MVAEEKGKTTEKYEDLQGRQPINQDYLQNEDVLKNEQNLLNKQAQLGVPDSRIQVELGFFLQA